MAIEHIIEPTKEEYLSTLKKGEVFTEEGFDNYVEENSLIEYECSECSEIYDDEYDAIECCDDDHDDDYDDYHFDEEPSDEDIERAQNQYENWLFRDRD